MKSVLFSIISILIIASNAAAQKRTIDFNAIATWTTIGSPAIRNDGKYVKYGIETGRYSSGNLGTPQIVFQSTGTSWKMTAYCRQPYSAGFTADSKTALFINEGDSLCLVSLGTDQCRYIPRVRFFRLQEEGKKRWLCYQLTDLSTLVIKDLVSGNEKVFQGVRYYEFGRDGKSLLLQASQNTGNGSMKFQWEEVGDGATKTIWEQNNVLFYDLDISGTRLAYITREQERNVLYYYDKKTSRVTRLADHDTPGFNDRLVIAAVKPYFSEDGARVFFRLKETEPPHPATDAVMVDVWSYKDDKILPQGRYIPGTYAATVAINDPRIIRLEQARDEIVPMRQQKLINDISAHYVVTREERFDRYGWNIDEPSNYYLVSVKDGSRKLLPFHSSNASLVFHLSPDERYLVYFDTDQQAYIAYEIETGMLKNLTSSLKVGFGKAGSDNPGSPIAIDFPIWSPDNFILVYDNYDIWKLDPSGRNAPLQLTQGWGAQNQVQLRLAQDHGKLDMIRLNGQPGYLLIGLNKSNKDNGFFFQPVQAQKSPQPLVQGPYIYMLAPHYAFASNRNTFLDMNPGIPPIKAKDANAWIVQRMSASESPNLYYTIDFKEYRPLSNLYPEKDFNWVTSELVKWTSLDGASLEGILYKPQDFDPAKKYPVIFHYYESASEALNSYIAPDAFTGSINIPYLVSSGYLVFVPDIRYRVGRTGESAVNAIVSAARHLSTMSWVDSKRLGVQGFSYGSFQTNYLVTHSRLFAAASSGCGMSDWISFYGDYNFKDGINQQYTEKGQGRMGVSLLKDPDLYKRNSPVFAVDDVTTPVLLMGNKKDPQNFQQILEFFIALHRSGKKAWMLQYDNGDHGVWGKDAIDHTIRMTQFFDHYLKGQPAPRWMIKGIPASMKGIDSGFELDGSGVEP